MAQGWEVSTGQPIPPQNGQVTSTFERGVLEVRWDNPALLASNSSFTVVGVNVYRSDVSDRGPYHRLNEYPVGVTFHQDRTDNVYISREVVTNWVFRGNAPNDRKWVFRSSMPMVKGSSKGPFQTVMAANAVTDVTVFIDGVEVPVHDVFGPSGEVTLINQPTFDFSSELAVDPVIPGADSVVEVSYWANRNHVRSGLDAHLFYRLTTVVLDPETPSGYRETNLEYTPAITLGDVESMDYIWREAVRRNNWILSLGGERVKVFLKKQSGVPCKCSLPDRLLEYGKQPSNRCAICYGTGFIGGYEGPYDIIIAPDDAERRLSQGANGRRMEHSQEVWIGPTPVVTQRDMIVKQTNERYSIGPVRRPSNRGNRLQQHFNIAYLDEQDIRYSVPIDGTTTMGWPETRYSVNERAYPPLPIDGTLQTTEWANPELPLFPVGNDAQNPMETEKAGVPAEKERRGRTPAWENQNH